MFQSHLWTRDRNLILANVMRLHGIPDDIISDRGAAFISHFWKQLFQLLGTTTKLSTAFHPQTDGKTECVNQVLEQYLRGVVRYQQEDWTTFLPLVEFAYYNTLLELPPSSPTLVSNLASVYPFPPVQ